jgi:DNA repair protein RecN (Recombination protein N)
MLTELRVRDLAVIQDVTLSLGPGLNVLTGETGAGKSMLVDALALLLGERATSDLIRPGSDRAVVEAAFDIGEGDLLGAADEAGVELIGDQLIFRRDINAAGRNRAWANGSPTTVTALASLGRRLVDLHGQHEAQSLLKIAAQRDILDAFGNLGATRQAAADAFARASALRSREADLVARKEDVKRRADYLRHVAKEITEADPRIGEYEELEIESKRLSNVEDLTKYAEALLQLLDGDGGAVLTALGQATRLVAQLERIDGSVSGWREWIDSAEANVAELVQVARRYVTNIETDPQRLAQVEARRDVLYRLKQKYGPAVEDVIRTGEQALGELELLDTADLDLAGISEEREVAERELEAVANELTVGRKNAAARLESAVDALLPGLGMEHGKLTVALQPAERATSAGKDVIEFLVNLNPGMEPRPLAQVASGGELSRLMLALKVVLAQHDAIPTLVFDEVDQGIGGEVAGQVSAALAQVALSRQVLIITHLPQIAARAGHHLRVDKPVRDGMPSSQVRVLTGDERVVELARMLGDAEDPVALKHAAEMIRRRGEGTGRGGGPGGPRAPSRG